MRRRRLLTLAALLATLGLFVASDSRAGVHLHLKLKVGPGRAYLVGRPPHPVGAPWRVTVHLKHAGRSHVRLFGLHPGGVFFAGVKAKPFKLHVKGPAGHVKVGPGGFKMKGKKGRGKWKF